MENTPTDVTAQLVPDTDVPTLETALDAMTADWGPFLDAADRVLLLPDTHYPFHFSTGLVTAPAVVRAACRLVERGTDATAVIGCTGGEHADPERCGRFLGYERLAEEEGVELRHLPADGGEPLPDGTAVFNLPTVRTGEGGTASANLRRAFGSAAEAPGPVRSVLDGTYSYTGTPQRSLFVAASRDVGDLDRWVVDLLSEPNDVDAEGVEPVAEPRAVSTADLRERFGVPRSFDVPDALDDAMGAGYRLYGRLTGDAVPPQFLRRQR